jgi:hypothetical protein
VCTEIGTKGITTRTIVGADMVDGVVASDPSWGKAAMEASDLQSALFFSKLEKCLLYKIELDKTESATLEPQKETKRRALRPRRENLKNVVEKGEDEMSAEEDDEEEDEAETAAKVLAEAEKQKAKLREVSKGGTPVQICVIPCSKKHSLLRSFAALLLFCSSALLLIYSSAPLLLYFPMLALLPL